MINLRRAVFSGIGFVFLSVFAVTPAQARPWAGRPEHGSGRPFHHERIHPAIGFHFSVLPDGFFSLAVRDRVYFYFDGTYYMRTGPEYVVVAPPPGAVVTVLPAEYQMVVINGVTYYINNGIYYVYTPQGYQVVMRPVVATSIAPVAAAATEADNTIIVNIPNDKGGYNAVGIKKVENGFIGPQGEFYHEFPRITQLQIMYGKAG